MIPVHRLNPMSPKAQHKQPHEVFPSSLPPFLFKTPTAVFSMTVVIRISDHQFTNLPLPPPSLLSLLSLYHSSPETSQWCSQLPTILHKALLLFQCLASLPCHIQSTTPASTLLHRLRLPHVFQQCNCSNWIIHTKLVI